MPLRPGAAHGQRHQVLRVGERQYRSMTSARSPQRCSRATTTWAEGVAKVDGTVTASLQSSSSSGPPRPPDALNSNNPLPPPILAPGRIGSSRGIVTDEILQELKEGRGIVGVYIGRGGRGVPPSKWGNPFKIGRDGTRGEVIGRYRDYFRQSAGLLNNIGELEGKVLWCHCRPDEPCHGDASGGAPHQAPASVCSRSCCPA